MLIGRREPATLLMTFKPLKAQYVASIIKGIEINISGDDTKRKLTTNIL